MRELIFVVDSLFALVVGAFLLRLLFQLVRADFRNPVAQAVVRVTNPLVVPLRKVLPPIGRLDTASVVALLLAQMLRTAAVVALSGAPLPGIAPLLLLSLVEVLDLALLILLVAIFVYVILGWVAPGGYSPVARLLGDLVEPVLAPLRRALPSLGGLDLSPLVAILLISVVRMVLNGRIAPLLLGL
ncbi:MAG: YggT family protein [Steroidobacteraceae bacterium]|jgi:YggT family protein|nr:YggT family protein [Steroidobacteraceae bacterium]